MAVKLTEKEISALSTKVIEKKKAANLQKKNAFAQKKLPEAKKVLSAINALPPQVLNRLYRTSYSKGSISALEMAKILCTDGDDDNEYEGIDEKTIAADIVLAARECATMALLCKKLAI